MSARRSIVLIGLPGAGKSTVAPYAATLLGSPWCDLDQRIVARTGKSIAEIFAVDGEPHFREHERAAMEDALAGAPQIIAAGGGWAAQAGNLGAVAGRALVLYLSLSPAEAATRLVAGGDRPLLTGDSPVRRLEELFTVREPWYRLADLEIPAGGAPPEAVAAGIATAARQYGGW